MLGLAELPFVDAFAVGVPAIVELARIGVGIFPENLVRPVPGTGCPVHEERLVRR